MEGKRSKLNILLEEIAPASRLKKENNNSAGEKSKIGKIIDRCDRSYNDNIINSGWDKIEKKVQQEYLNNLKRDNPKQYYRLIAGYGKKTTSKKRKRKQRRKKT